MTATEQRNTATAALPDTHLAPAQDPAAPPATASSAPAVSAPRAKDLHYIALRNFALSITVLNVLGYAVLGFEQPWLWPIVCVLTAYATEVLFELLSAWARQRPPRFGRGARGMYEFLLPTHITALAVNMLLYANNQVWPILFGVIAGVTAKHVLQAPINGRMRHYMNPSNFGITLVLLTFSWVSVAPPYQYGENLNTLFRIGLPMLVLTAGTVLNAMLTRKMPLIVGWLGGFVIQALVRWVLFDISIMSALGIMTGVGFVLFTNYMISDPGTTPFKPLPQFAFGASVATVYGVLLALNVVYTLFFAVCIVCLGRGMYWWGREIFGRCVGARPGS